jgi:glycosyltransferase involved in cell wall biosynthesis
MGGAQKLVRDTSASAPGEDRGRRILMIAPTSFFADYGCHVRILEEVRALGRLGHEVTICTYHNGRDLPDVDIRRTLSIPWRKGYEVGSSRHKIAFDILLGLRSLAAMWQVKPDIIHAHLHEGALLGGLLSRLWGVPMVFDFQGSMTSEMVDHRFLRRDGPFYRPMLRLETWIDRFSPQILTSSQHARDLLMTDFGMASNKLTCIPDGVNTHFFRPMADREEIAQLKRAWGIPDGRFVVVYLGKLAQYQGTDYLLQAAQQLCSRRKDVHFLIAGYPFVDYYTEVSRKLGIAEYVTLPGKVAYEEAPKLLAVGDVAVSPKLSETEGAGKLLNYMATALPTVVFDNQVSREYLGDWGVYARPRDSAHLAACIEALIDDPARRATLGTALRQRAQAHYSWDSIGQSICEVYASMLR